MVSNRTWQSMRFSDDIVDDDYIKKQQHEVKNMTEKKWNKIEGSDNFWQPEKVNDEISGILLTREEGMYGPSYTINSNGKEIRLPSHKVLQARLEKVALGADIKIVFIGVQLPKIAGRKPTQIYDVFVAE